MDRMGDLCHRGPSDESEISLMSLPSTDSVDSLLGKASVPRKRNPSRHRHENGVHGSQQFLPDDPSPTSFSEVNGDVLEKGYGDEYRRRAAGALKPRNLIRWSTYAAAVVCCMFALFATITIVSYGMWDNTDDRGQCGSLLESEEIMALKASSTLEHLKNGAVASDQRICSEIGLAMLRDFGGHAIDAAVATALCVGVVNPVSSGLGGGAFILIHSDSPKTTSLPLFHDKRDEGAEAQSKEGMVTEVIDAREIAPAGATTEMFLKADEHASVFGGLASAVPGELRGLELAHARHGRLPWATVVSPAMKLARDGVPVSVHLAAEIKKIVARASNFPGYPSSLRKLISKDNKVTKPLKAGETLRNPALAQTLRAVMEKGADAVYIGDLAAKFVDDIRASDGIITLEDLESYRPTLRSPMVAEDVSGFTLVGAPPPSTGGVVVAGVLRFLSRYKTPFASVSDTLSVHRMVEACRHAYALRMSLCDPQYNTETTKDVVYDLTRGKFMDSLRKITKDESTLRLSEYGGKWSQLKDTEGQAEAYDAHEGDRRLRTEVESMEGGKQGEVVDDDREDFLTSGAADEHITRRLARPFGYLEDFGTSHISVVDKDGNAVALTTSINSKFGSGVFSESTGILLNNQMDDFGTPSKTSFYGVRPSESNYVKPGKKPLSSMSPLFLFRRQEGAQVGEWGDLYLVIGGSGGPKIITAVLQVILNFVFRGMPLFESMAHPRVHDQLLYQDAHVTTVEHGRLVEGPLISVSNRTRSALANRGHKLLELDYLGTVQAIAIDSETGELSAVSDIRKGGTPAGY